MLRVSLHAGPAGKANRFNLVAWVDIGYDRLAPVADYTVVLYQSGIGATMPLPLSKYPRWSSSLWDLAARSIAIGLNDSTSEAVPKLETRDKQFAFLTEMSVVIEHYAGGDVNWRTTLGTAALMQHGRKRGTYVAKFEEHTMQPVTIAPFEFKPAFLQPVELLLHACLHRMNGKAEMPARPALCVPMPVQVEGVSYVPVHHLVEPARTGLLNWMNWNGMQPKEHDGAPQGLVPDSVYSTFLREAV